MKITAKLCAALVVGLMGISAAHATTSPSKIIAFTQTDGTTVNVKNTMSTRAKGWSDPAFGDLGWVHSSAWGTYTATAGQVVTMTFVSNEIGMHPASTIYYRGDKDTAADNYIPDVALTQNATMAKWGASDDATGAPLGDIVMQYVTHAYDADNNTSRSTVFKGKKDKKSGKLVISFKAPYTGNYMFVVSGYNPAPTVDTSVAHPVDVTVDVK